MDSRLGIAVGGVARENICRGDVAVLSCANCGACRNDLDPETADGQMTEIEKPLAGRRNFYITSAAPAGGVEGTLGFGASAERSNDAPAHGRRSAFGPPRRAAPTASWSSARGA